MIGCKRFLEKQLEVPEKLNVERKKRVICHL